MTNELPEDLVIRRSRRARKLTLQVDQRSGAVILTLPLRVSKAEGLEFVDRQSDWIAQNRAALPEAATLLPGTEVPILGVAYTIVYDAKTGRKPLLDPDAKTLTVGGSESEALNRVRRFLRSLAQDTITPKAQTMAAKLGVKISHIRMGNQYSRWGSCNSQGVLAFSWRLIGAPEWVLDYVIAHEVSHLKEMNHSPRFWRVVATLVDTTDDARHWLKTEGAMLHRIG